MNPKPIDGLRTEEAAALRELKAECRGKMFLTAAVVLGVTVCAAGLLSLAGIFSFWEAAALLGFLALLVLSPLLRGTETKCKLRARQTPNMLPPELMPDDTQLADECRRIREAQKIKTERGLILTVGIILSLCFFPFAFFLIAVIILRWKAWSRLFGPKPLSPFHAHDVIIESAAGFTRAAAVVLWIFVMVLTVYAASCRYTANSKVQSINAAAKTLYHAAVFYQEELKENGEDWRLKTTIVEKGKIGEADSLSAGVYLYFTESEQFWYAVVCDSDGNITETYISRSELTLSDLHPQSPDEQRALYSKPFRGDEVIGYYAPPPESGNDNISISPTTEVITYGQAF